MVRLGGIIDLLAANAQYHVLCYDRFRIIPVTHPTMKTVSYPFGKGKQSVLKVLENDIPGLDKVLGKPGATQSQLKATVDAFFLLLYGQKSCTTMNDA